MTCPVSLNSVTELSPKHGVVDSWPQPLWFLIDLYNLREGISTLHYISEWPNGLGIPGNSGLNLLVHIPLS